METAPSRPGHGAAADPVRVDPVCANCGHTRRGMADPDAPCSECGARVSWPGASPRWLITFYSGLRTLRWSIPAMLLAWLSPAILRVAGAGDSTMPLVQKRSWLLLIAGAPIAFALAQLSRCLPRSLGAVWCARLAVLALVFLALDAAGAGIYVQRLVSLAIPNSYNFTRSLWPSAVMVVLAGAAIPAGAVLAAAVRECGLMRTASRLWWTTVVAAMAGAALHMWARDGGRFAPAPPDRLLPGQTAPANSAFAIVEHSIEVAAFLGPFLVAALALVAWHAAWAAAAQLTAAGISPVLPASNASSAPASAAPPPRA